MVALPLALGAVPVRAALQGGGQRQPHALPEVGGGGLVDCLEEAGTLVGNNVHSSLAFERPRVHQLHTRERVRGPPGHRLS